MIQNLLDIADRMSDNALKIIIVSVSLSCLVGGTGYTALRFHDAQIQKQTVETEKRLKDELRNDRKTFKEYTENAQRHFETINQTTRNQSIEFARVRERLDVLIEQNRRFFEDAYQMRGPRS